MNYKGKLEADYHQNVCLPMTFKNENVRDKFFNTFKDLLEIAKPFL